MKRVITGWIGKSGELVDKMSHVTETAIYISSNKGRPCEWSECEWPPRKVKVTIETVKK